jgi:hypothetical protein
MASCIHKVRLRMVTVACQQLKSISLPSMDSKGRNTCFLNPAYKTIDNIFHGQQNYKHFPVINCNSIQDHRQQLITSTAIKQATISFPCTELKETWQRLISPARLQTILSTKYDRSIAAPTRHEATTSARPL